MDYVYAAEIANRCKDKGIQAKTLDCLIAAVAINHNCLLITSDGDFEHMAKVVPLQIL
jgi:predicted nucleic acid-binding protein